MDDTPKPTKPPPLPEFPLRLVRPKPPDQVVRELRDTIARLQAELEAERSTVQILRQQYSERLTGPHDDTLPGVGATKRDVRAFGQRRLARGARRRRVWVPIAAALLTAAATAAGLRYPGLMGPINDVAKALTGAFQ